MHTVVLGLETHSTVTPESTSTRDQNRPSGRPSAGRRADMEAFPIRIQPKSGPGNPISGPEALSCNIGSVAKYGPR